MFLDPYHSIVDGHVCVSSAQGSRFAKEVAGDFNPLHDEGARRFCVPGDLLFSLVLARYGLSQRMSCRFVGMVGDGVPLCFPEQPGAEFDITDTRGKVFVHIERAGENTRDERVVEAIARQYVAFSGKNFPHYLEPLMASKGVMFNPARPLVMYDSMDFAMQRLDLVDPRLELADSTLEVAGKRGDSMLYFKVYEGDEVVGSGSKKIVMSGLREYDHEQVQAFVAEFYRLKEAYEARR